MKFGDEELMVMFAAGVKEAFDMLYERYRDRIYRFAAACLKNREDAEDVVQEVFIRVARSAARYEPRGRFKSWIFQIAAHRIHSTAQVREQRLSHERWEADDTLLDIPDGRIDPERTILSRDTILKALSILPRLQRMILILKEVEGLDAAAIGETLAMSAENVRVNLHRARRKLLQATTAGRRESA